MLKIKTTNILNMAGESHSTSIVQIYSQTQSSEIVVYWVHFKQGSADRTS